MLGMIGSLPEASGDVEIGMSVWKGLYSLDIIKKYGIFFPSEREYISEDIIFHMQYLIKAQCVVIEETPNYYYCDNGISLTKSYKANRFRMEKILLKKEIQELDQIFGPEVYRQRLYKAFLGRVRRCIAQEVILNPKKQSVRKNIRAICKDETVQKVIKDFDSSHLQIMKRLVNALIQYKCILALMILFKIKR